MKLYAAALSLEENAHLDEGWLAATVPGTVQQDLLAAGRMPDPFVGLREQDVQWVGESDWLYRCIFDAPATYASASAIDLCCEGLDTFVTGWLNGVQIFANDNMFIPLRVDVKASLRAGQNTLLLLFESPLRKGRERETQYGVCPVWNGDTSRVYVRKAQYHYGWDWGPTLLTSGPWREIRLESYTLRIEELHCAETVAADLQHATLPVHLVLAGAQDVLPADLTASIALYAPTGECLEDVTLPVTAMHVQHEFALIAPQLWWPRGYGDQSRYQVVVVLRRGQEEWDRRVLQLGLRRLRLIQEPLTDEPGTSFLFEVNNTPIFCGGANWIPADSFLPSITPERYRAWLQLAADAHMLMLRVWGGGIYEYDVFYDLCDELGILVWQDFLFACGLYATPDWFLDSVRVEAEATLRRLRHHPCLVLWCGNNEDYLVAASRGLYPAALTEETAQSAFPAQMIYEQLLPEICARLDPTRPYWPGSPYAGRNAQDRTQGDIHCWEVWHGAMLPYQEYPRLAGRFVSEFGMQSLPDMKTIASFTTSEERYPQSRTLDHHNKAEYGARRIVSYLVENVRIPTELDAYVYATQFLQSEALATAIRGWRRLWRGPGRYATAGALVWQLNDCWPVTSWAVVDYALRPKPAYYTLRRELSPVVVGLARRPPGDTADYWAVNGTTVPVEVALELQTWTQAGELVAEKRLEIVLTALQATELGAMSLQPDKQHVLSATLWQGDVVVSRATLWPEPFKYLSLPEPEVQVTSGGDNLLYVSAKRPAKGVWLTADGQVHWSDNMLDLVPGDVQIITASGLDKQQVHTQWLRG